MKTKKRTTNNTKLSNCMNTACITEFILCHQNSNYLIKKLAMSMKANFEYNVGNIMVGLKNNIAAA